MSAPAALHSAIQVLTFTILRPAGQPISILPDEDPARVWYTHPDAPSRARPVPRPKQLELHVVGMRAGETLEIHLARLAGGHLRLEDAPALLRSIFPTAAERPHGFGWVLPFGAEPVLSGEAFCSLGRLGRLRLKYDLELYRGDHQLAENDPDINLIPDP